MCCTLPPGRVQGYVALTRSFFVITGTAFLLLRIQLASLSATHPTGARRVADPRAFAVNLLPCGSFRVNEDSEVFLGLDDLGRCKFVALAFQDRKFQPAVWLVQSLDWQRRQIPAESHWLASYARGIMIRANHGRAETKPMFPFSAIRIFRRHYPSMCTVATLPQSRRDRVNPKGSSETRKELY
ncbi:hypothetical protein HD554DRAFT_2036010 [Boletus coccyginus]|nr:hypothetical protein HD554DRAFT_2036010 [Boletus coccyginus]